MPRTILGKVSLTPKGEYSPDTAYTALDVVSYGGSSWLALQDVTGVAPVEGESWMLLAQKGDQGASFTRLEKTAGTGAPGTIDTYTAYNSEGREAGTVNVYNGMDGTGAGDFKADGTVPMTGDLQMAQHKVTGLADATEDGDAVNKGQMDAALAERADLTLSNLSNKQKALRNIGGRPNRNLLDNWYFAGGGSQQGGGQFPINQRRETQYSGSNVNAIDRWLVNNGEITLAGDELTLKNTDESTGRNCFLQRIENPEMYAGKTLTFSILYKNSTGNIAASAYANNNGANVNGNLKSDPDGIVSVTFSILENAEPTEFRVHWLLYPGVSCTPIAAKLELGPTQTLAYQDEDGNWQLFETPDYGEELAKCQRYYEQSYWNVFYAVANSITQIDFLGNVVFSKGKRVFPTITVGSNPSQILTVKDASNGFTTVSGCALQIPTAFNKFMLSPRLTGNFTVGHVYRVIVPDNAYIINAEL